MEGNYPAGVSSSHPHFNPPTCAECGEEGVEGEDCQACGGYMMTAEDIAEMKADMAFDAARDAEMEERY